MLSRLHHRLAAALLAFTFGMSHASAAGSDQAAKVRQAVDEAMKPVIDQLLGVKSALSSPLKSWGTLWNFGKRDLEARQRRCWELQRPHPCWLSAAAAAAASNA